MSLCLLIDTTIQGVSLGIASLEAKSELLFVDSTFQNENSSTALSCLLSQGLEKTSSQKNDIAAICVSAGPGSFTGIKVGLAYTYGIMKAVSDLVTLEVSSLESLAEHYEQALLLPGTRTQGFLSYRSEGKMRTESVFTDKTDDDFWARFAAHKSAKLLKPWPEFAALAAKKAIDLELLDLSRVCPDSIHAMWQKAQKAWPQGFQSSLPNPRYLRRSTAEEHLGL